MKGASINKPAETRGKRPGQEEGKNDLYQGTVANGWRVNNNAPLAWSAFHGPCDEAVISKQHSNKPPPPEGRLVLIWMSEGND